MHDTDDEDCDGLSFGRIMAWILLIYAALAIGWWLG